MKLHSYWRSTASYRVRIALNLKELVYEQKTRDLRIGEQATEAYTTLNAQNLVPTLETADDTLVQSLAIIEWLDERYPSPPLKPQNITQRAAVNAMASIIACDIHPLNNLRVLKTLRGEFQANENQINAWIARWIRDGFAALEHLISHYGGIYACGDDITLADCCLVPQMYSAERFGVSVESFPRTLAAANAARLLPAFSDAHPDLQPDADT